MQQHIEWLHILGLQAAQHLFERLWSEAWLEKFAASKNKAYKVIDEAQVHLLGNESPPIYLPSRIRRCIAEQVGRILRYQAQRKACYDDL